MRLAAGSISNAPLLPSLLRSDTPYAVYAAALLGVALVLGHEASYGVALFGDTIYYISAARNALAGEGLYTFDGEPLTTWPPFYPLLLLLIAGLGALDPAAVVGPLNVALFGLTILVVGNYLRQRLESRFLALWACFALALATPLVDVASRGLTEPLFILLATLALVYADRALASRGKSALLWAAVFAALAWQTRYLGVVVPMVVGLLLLFQRGVAWPSRMGRTAAYSAIVALPMGLWMLRNYLLVGALSGPRPWGGENPWNFATETILAVLVWLAGFDPALAETSWFAAWSIVVGLALPSLVAAAVILVRVRRLRRTPFDWRPCWLFGSFALAYYACLVGLSVRLPPDAFQPRYITLLCVPILVGMAFALDWLLRREREHRLAGYVGSESASGMNVGSAAAKPSVLAGALATALGLWIAGQIIPNVIAIKRENSATENTRDLSAPRWRDSETLRYLRANPIESKVFSNELSMAYFNNAGKSKRYAALRNYSTDYEFGFAREESLIAGAPDGAYVVWFRNWDDHIFPFGYPQMRVTTGLELVAELADGAIFKVSKGHVPPNPYRDTYERIEAGGFGEPAARSIFDIYRAGRTLIYFKQPCTLADTKHRFFLHFTYVRGDVGAANFNFPELGAVLDGDACVAIASLPAEALQHVRTGQSDGGDLWSTEPEVTDLYQVGDAPPSGADG